MFSTHEMLCLADVKNLGVLELIQPIDDGASVFPQISDRLIRGWTEKDDPFPLLRMLKIWANQSTTQESLQWVSKFPSLALYDVVGAKEDWQSPVDVAQAEGWELADVRARLEDSLLRSLMLFSPIEETSIHSLRNLSKSIDLDLISVSVDSQSIVKFIPQGRAPPLLDYLMDTAKGHAYLWEVEAPSQEARACHALLLSPGRFGSTHLSGSSARTAT